MVVAGYGGVAWMALLGMLVPTAALIVAYFVMPQSVNRWKTRVYESGIEPTGEAWVQFNVRYYLFALIFVIFDVEAVFLYPWAVTYRQMGLMALLDVLIFLGILVVGLAYAWKKGALEWAN